MNETPVATTKASGVPDPGTNEGDLSSPRHPTSVPVNVNNTPCHHTSDDPTKEKGTPAKSGIITTAHSDSRMLVSADGTQIYANAVGDPTKQAIVFIHGFAWSSMAFDDIFNDPQWTSQMYLVRYDVRGHGRTGKPGTDEGWESKRLAEDFDTVVNAFKLHRPFVAGWSLGASHLMDILSLRPIDYVAGIINIAGATYISDNLMTRAGTPLVVGFLEKMTSSPDVDEFRGGAIGFIDACCRTLPYDVRQICLGNIMTQPRSAMIRSLTRKQDQGAFERLGNTDIPCLVIYGDEDEAVSVHRLPGFYQHWKNATVEAIKGGSHVPWSKTDERVAEVFTEKMLGWIQGVMGSTNS